VGVLGVCVHVAHMMRMAKSVLLNLTNLFNGRYWLLSLVTVQSISPDGMIRMGSRVAQNDRGSSP
jgi:hypothetical protein